MLDAQIIATVKATAPAIAKLGPTLTTTFYGKMLAAHPELKNVFNISNQRTGAQSGALFNAVLAYAQHIDNLTALLPAVELIAQKHASLLIRPDQYPIVGKYLLEAVDELLNPGPDVLGAWEKAYGVLADIFITRESEIYQASASEDGGWRGVRAFQIAGKVKASDTITRFELAPVDGKKIIGFEPGQYLALFLKPQTFDYRQIRQYSLTHRSDGSHRYRIAVKREEKGIVSRWLHQHAREGDVVELAPPRGEFRLKAAPHTSITLISAGVGATPLLAMLDSLAHDQHPSRVNWFHAAANSQQEAFRHEVAHLGEGLKQFNLHTWYSKPTSEDRQRRCFDSEGHMELAPLESAFSAPDRQFYLCGPTGFMQNIISQLTRLGVSASQIHYECFGPLKAL